MRSFNDCLAPLLGLALAAGCSSSTQNGPNAGDASTQDAGYPCASEVCTGTQVCCQAPTGVKTCSEKSACQGIASTCASAKDCAAGQVCCGSFQSFAMVDIECKAQCTPGPGAFQPCALGTECPAGQSCVRGTQVMICVPTRDAGALDAAAD